MKSLKSAPIHPVINAAKPIKLDRWTGKTWVKEDFTNVWREAQTR